MILDNSSQKGQLTSYTSKYENILKLDIFWKLKWRKNTFILQQYYIYLYNVNYSIIPFPIWSVTVAKTPT